MPSASERCFFVPCRTGTDLYGEPCIRNAQLRKASHGRPLRRVMEGVGEAADPFTDLVKAI
jgi:hypothetical protein